MTIADEHMNATAATVARWLARQGVALRAPVELSQIAGGRSNLTYLIADSAGQRLVLRRPPTGGVLETAHSMSREWRFISALNGTGVPVPRPVAFCDDPAVVGASFYVMEHVDGLVLHTREAAGRLEASARAAASTSVAATLGRLHTVDPQAVGLSDAGRGDGYVDRQLRRWHGQWDKARAVAGLDVRAIDDGHRALASAVPALRGVSIVHGDFRLGNVVTGADGSVRAVLDWELATLGDPRADLGWLLLSWAEPDEVGGNPSLDAPSSLPGFGRRAALVEAYLNEAGAAAASDTDYFVAFAAWRWACISAGVYARYQAGVMGSETADLPAVLEAIRDHAEFALELVAGRHSVV
jgi:aminoglycoside phosphotransferase (APT) family kinase protein